MTKSSRTMKVIEYAFGASLIASLAVLLVAACLFGFQVGRWPEWQGRLVAVLETIAGVAGAVFGLRMALRAER